MIPRAWQCNLLLCGMYDSAVQLYLVLCGIAWFLFLFLVVEFLSYWWALLQMPADEVSK